MVIKPYVELILLMTEFCALQILIIHNICIILYIAYISRNVINLRFMSDKLPNVVTRQLYIFLSLLTYKPREHGY